ncbi:MAG: molybdate ABC transporter substrate-binding protein [Candidatus Competibacterales bacterium]
MPLEFSRRRLSGLVASLVLGGSIGPRAIANGDAVLIFAAASTKNAMDEIAGRFAAETGRRAVVSLAGSSVLARQIQQGAPADVFVSANPDWMDVLERGGLIDPQTRFDLLENTLVLIAHGPNRPPVAVGPDLDLLGLLGQGRLAMALVDAVPAGIYGKAALESLGLWPAIAPRVAQVDNVRAALTLVARGATPLGIVYATDAVAAANVTVLGTFPANTHPPIVYPAAAVATRANPLTDQFLVYLRGPGAREAFARQGFAIIAE